MKTFTTLDIDPWITASGFCFALSAALVIRAFILTTPLPLPSGGTRGNQRSRALRSPIFRLVDPAVRRLGAIVRTLFSQLQSYRRLKKHIAQIEEFQRQQLIWAGEPLGLNRHEALGLSIILAALGALIGRHLGGSSNSLAWVLPSGIFGAALLNIRLQSLSTARFTEVSRELPASIDLIALAMNAGSDFPGAVRRVIHGQRGVVAEELGHVLRALDLGITRRAALLSFRDRMPVQEVRDLVRAILLAEKKGSSITEALAQQARASRERRSVRAEEAAARAGVLLLVPLMLLMACILILLVGPLLSSGVSL
jgi:tight adherence protein C